MKLAPHEIKSQLWDKLKVHYTEKLHQLRISLESDIDERKTAKIRGQILEIKRLLAMGDPSKQKEADAG